MATPEVKALNKFNLFMLADRAVNLSLKTTK